MATSYDIDRKTNDISHEIMNCCLCDKKSTTEINLHIKRILKNHWEFVFPKIAVYTHEDRRQVTVSIRSDLDYIIKYSKNYSMPVNTQVRLCENPADNILSDTTTLFNVVGEQIISNFLELLIINKKECTDRWHDELMSKLGCKPETSPWIKQIIYGYIETIPFRFFEKIESLIEKNICDIDTFCFIVATSKHIPVDLIFSVNK